MKKVLIVESDEYTAKMLAESLVYLDYDPLVWTYNQSLPLMLINSNPDIVIIHRPLFVKNRALFISPLNDHERLTGASLILTSNAILDPRRVKELGADFFLFKPFELETLAEVLRKSVDHFQQE